MIRVRAVEIAPNYELLIAFTDGQRRCFDMKPYLSYPVFQRLKNESLFSLASVDYGTVVWPGEIDIAPETLYEESVPIT